jgi:polyisoprenoid-binding protein YceI
MEKKNWIYVLIPLFAVSLLVYLYATQNRQQPSSSKVIANLDVAPSPEVVPDTLGITDPESNIEEIQIPVSPSMRTFNFDEGSTASYTIKKEFLKKPSQDVIGKGDGVNGYGSISLDGTKIKVEASVDIKTVKTDSPKRDSDVLKFFSSTVALLDADAVLVNPLQLGVERTETLPAKFTLNNVTKEVPFTVTATVTENSLKAVGSTRVKLSEFDIQPPALADVFSVSDEITFSFDVVGTRKN